MQPARPQKTCCKCGLPKDLENDFSIKRSNVDGRNRTCKECHRGYTRKHYEDNKGYYVAKAKRYCAGKKPPLRELVDGLRDRPCLDCGNSYPLCCMEFDHIDSTNKLYNVSSMINGGFSRKLILDEIAKCEVVCANCHRIRTHNRRTEIVAERSHAPVA